MGSCFSKDSKIKIIDQIPLGDDFNYLRPKGYINYMVDTKYNLPLIEINFDGWFETSVRLWPESKNARSKFILLERTPPPSLSVFSISSIIDDSGSILFFSKKKMAQKQILHPRDRFAQPSAEILMNFQQGRLLITKEEFHFRVETFPEDLKRIREFAKFTTANIDKLFEKKLMCGDVRIFSRILQEFLDKKFVNPQ